MIFLWFWIMCEKKSKRYFCSWPQLSQTSLWKPRGWRRRRRWRLKNVREKDHPPGTAFKRVMPGRGERVRTSNIWDVKIRCGERCLYGGKESATSNLMPKRSLLGGGEKYPFFWCVLRRKCFKATPCLFLSAFWRVSPRTQRQRC